MLDRGKYVIGPMPEQDRCFDARQVDAPEPAHRQHIVDPAIGAISQRLGIGFGQQPANSHVINNPAVRSGEFRTQGLKQAFGVVADLIRQRYQLGLNRCQPIVCPVAFADVESGHSVEPVQVLGVRWGKPNQDRRALYPFAQSSRTGEGVRTAAGAADNTETVDPQLVSDGAYIRSRVRDGPPAMTTRHAVARSVVADQPDTQPVQDARPWSRAGTAARRAVQQEDGHAVRPTPALHGHAAPIGNIDHLRHQGLPQSTGPPRPQQLPMAARANAQATTAIDKLNVRAPVPMLEGYSSKWTSAAAGWTLVVQL